MSLDLGVHESPQDMRRDGEVCEDKLGLLMKAEEGEVVQKLHGLNGILLLFMVDPDDLYKSTTLKDII